MKRFVISDLHLGHVKIRDYEPIRQTWGEDWIGMTDTIINAWSAVVQKEDEVFVLGDFAMGIPDNIPKYRGRLPGRITLIRGNHDRHPERWLDSSRGDDVYTQLRISDPVLGTVTMRHDPSHFTPEDRSSSDLLLHGHIHSNPYGFGIPDDVVAKCRCLSVEVLPTCPGPLEFSLVGDLPVGTLRGKWVEPNHRSSL